MDFSHFHDELLLRCKDYYTSADAGKRQEAHKFLNSISTAEVLCSLSRICQNVTSNTVTLNPNDKPEYWAFVFGFGLFYNCISLKFFSLFIYFFSWNSLAFAHINDINNFVIDGLLNKSILF